MSDSTLVKNVYSNLQMEITKLINDKPLIYYGAKATFLALILAFFFRAFLSLSYLKYFHKYSSYGLRLSSWYEFIENIIVFFLDNQNANYINTAHMRLSFAMGVMASYKCATYSLVLCYFIMYFRYFCYCLSHLLKQFSELSKSLQKFSQEKSINTLLAYLEVFAFFEALIWSFIYPSKAKYTYFFYYYYFIIITFCYHNDKVHKHIWSRIYTIINNSIGQTSFKNDVGPSIKGLMDRISVLTTYFATIY